MAGGTACARLAMLMRKITIVGGGLAGLSLAAALCKKGIPVSVIEAGRYPRHRVCGEFISGVSEQTLERLGILELLADARRHRTLAWYESGKPMHRDSLPEPALGISRFVLDERLRLHVEALGGEIRQGERARPQAAEGQVWAAGKPPRQGRWIGLKAHVRGLPMAADLEMHAGGNGYAGLARVEDDWVNICGLFHLDKSIRGRGAALLSGYLRSGGHAALAEAAEARDCREGSFSAMAGFEFGRQSGRDGLVCLGDAGSLIPPFTGNGMSMAFESAELALDPLLDWCAGGREWHHVSGEIRDRLGSRFHRRLMAANLMQRVLLDARGRRVLRSLSAARMLPFRSLLALVR